MTSMYSPPRTVRVDPRVDTDLGTLKRQLLIRNEEQEFLTRAHENDKNTLNMKAAQVSASLSDASATLTRRAQQIDDSERELAKISAMRNQRLQAKQQRLEDVSSADAELRRDRDGLARAVRAVDEDVVNVRRQLAKVQLEVDKRRELTSDISRSISDSERNLERVKEIGIADEGRRERQQATLERRVSDFETQLESVLEGSRRFATTIAASEEAHSSRVSSQKIECDNVRGAVSEAQSHIAALRKSVGAAMREMEEAQRRQRKSDEDGLAEHIASRSAELQKLKSTRDERTREMRSETARQREALNGQNDAATAQLNTIRDEMAQLFNEELHLHGAIRGAERSLEGQTVLEERRRNAERGIEQVERRDAATSESVHGMNDALRTLLERLSSLKDATAPLPEVESSVVALTNRCESLRSSAADNEANHAVWVLRQQDKEKEVASSTAKLEADAAAADEQAVEVEKMQQEQIANMHGEVRVLNTEIDSIASKVDEAKARAEVLDSTLEHISRQRRQMQEEMNARRDAAKAAAASLLAQLE